MQYVNIQAQRQPVARPEKRRIRKEEIESARGYARRGHSLSFTAQLLGLYPQQLAALLEAAGVDDIQFAKGRQSLESKRQLAELHASMRGRPQRNVSSAWLAALARGRETTRKKYLRSAFGVTGTVKELKDHFGCKLTLMCLYKRLQKGMTIEEALTKESMALKPGVVAPWLAERVLVEKRRSAERVKDTVARQLTPTMLQYRSPEHDIVVTGRHVAWMAVEVRTEVGVVLHRLRFIKSFGSGVLFVFNPNERGRIDFIAFEPSNQALVFDRRTEVAGE